MAGLTPEQVDQVAADLLIDLWREVLPQALGDRDTGAMVEALRRKADERTAACLAAQREDSHPQPGIDAGGTDPADRLREVLADDIVETPELYLQPIEARALRAFIAAGPRAVALELNVSTHQARAILDRVAASIVASAEELPA